MSILQKNGYEYADGGFSSLIPVDVAVDFEDVDIVDVIILSPKNNHQILPKSTNAFQTLSKVFDFSMNNSHTKDILLGQLKSRTRKIDVNIYYTPELLTEYPLIFDPDTMSKWWEMGYEFAKNQQPECHCYNSGLQ
jgi:predicted acylesterase/phospholipase RssA